MFACLIAAVLCSASKDRRADPFQFNICVWNLQGFDSRNDRDSDEEAVAKVIYSSLSTCDMYVIPGIFNHETRESLLEKMEKQSFSGFSAYPGVEYQSDVTVISRIDPSNLTSLKTRVHYPVVKSNCNYSGPGGETGLGGSFYGDYTFHDPVPSTRIFNVQFSDSTTSVSSSAHKTESAHKSESVSEEVNSELCAIREAQASLVCDYVSSVPSEMDVIVSGSFGGDRSESYSSILKGCGLVDTSSRKKGSVYSRGDHHMSDNVYVNKRLYGWVDQMTIKQDLSIHLGGVREVTYPVSVFIPQPLSGRWKTFEIVFSVVSVCVSGSFFGWLMLFSRLNKSEDYQAL